MINLDTQQVLNGCHLQRNTAVVQCRVNLCRAVAGDVHPGITHNRDQVHALTISRDVSKHDAICTGAAHLSCFRTGTSIATEQQDVLARTLHNIVAVTVIQDAVAVLIVLARVSCKSRSSIGAVLTASVGAVLAGVRVGDGRSLQLRHIELLSLAKLLLNFAEVFIHLSDGVKLLGLAIPGVASTPNKETNTEGNNQQKNQQDQQNTLDPFLLLRRFRVSVAH